MSESLVILYLNQPGQVTLRARYSSASRLGYRCQGNDSVRRRVSRSGVILLLLNGLIDDHQIHASSLGYCTARVISVLSDGISKMTHAMTSGKRSPTPLRAYVDDENMVSVSTSPRNASESRSVCCGVVCQCASLIRRGVRKIDRYTRAPRSEHIVVS